jgi:hypothetical protein
MSLLDVPHGRRATQRRRGSWFAVAIQRKERPRASGPAPANPRRHSTIGPSRRVGIARNRHSHGSATLPLVNCLTITVTATTRPRFSDAGPVACLRAVPHAPRRARARPVLRAGRAESPAEIMLTASVDCAKDLSSLHKRRRRSPRAWTGARRRGPPLAVLCSRWGLLARAGLGHSDGRPP